jgi:hypothetical protein
MSTAVSVPARLAFMGTFVSHESSGSVQASATASRANVRVPMRRPKYHEARRVAANAAVCSPALVHGARLVRLILRHSPLAGFLEWYFPAGACRSGGELPLRPGEWYWRTRRTCSSVRWKFSEILM